MIYLHRMISLTMITHFFDNLNIVHSYDYKNSILQPHHFPSYPVHYIYCLIRDPYFLPRLKNVGAALVTAYYFCYF